MSDDIPRYDPKNPYRRPFPTEFALWCSTHGVIGEYDIYENAYRERRETDHDAVVVRREAIDGFRATRDECDADDPWEGTEWEN